MPRSRICAHYSRQSLKEVVLLDRNKQVEQIGESLVMWVVAMRPLEDAGKDGWTMEDFSVVTVAVELGLHQIGRTD
ncbi:hypothetical protein TNCV_4967221 [Trichonephila clavipes]|nr:hypothetical protein TNCV_4967221 [Trichonephila clavipes]